MDDYTVLVNKVTNDKTRDIIIFLSTIYAHIDVKKESLIFTYSEEFGLAQRKVWPLL